MTASCAAWRQRGLISRKRVKGAELQTANLQEAVDDIL